MTESFRGLKVYQKSYEMIKKIYKDSNDFPKEELYGITSQIRRSATSIALNIAEGYGRKANVKDYKSFLIISKGSCYETSVLIDLIFDIGYKDEQWKSEMIEKLDEIAKMLQGLINSLEK